MPLDEETGVVAKLEASPAVATALAAHTAALTAERAWERELNDVLRGLLDPSERPPPLPRLAGRLRIETLRAQAQRAGEEGRSATRMLETAYVQLSYYVPVELRQRGETAVAVVALDLATRIFPERPIAWYDLACARAQAGSRRAAVDAFAEAVERGFAYPELAGRDPDLDPLRDDPRFSELVDGLSGTPPPTPAR